jgi:hypothetical protein
MLILEIFYVFLFNFGEIIICDPYSTFDLLRTLGLMFGVSVEDLLFVNFLMSNYLQIAYS